MQDKFLCFGASEKPPLFCTNDSYGCSATQCSFTLLDSSQHFMFPAHNFFYKFKRARPDILHPKDFFGGEGWHHNKGNVLRMKSIDHSIHIVLGPAVHRFRLCDKRCRQVRERMDLDEYIFYHMQQGMQTPQRVGDTCRNKDRQHKAQTKATRRNLRRIHLDPIHWRTNPQESDGDPHVWEETNISM